jgi:hypothetical protein
MDGIGCLRETISTVPVPGAPPRLSRDGAVVGLAFLDAALRLNHVRRLTERLSVVEHRIAHRTTEVDISLNMLDSDQSAAASLFRQLASHSSANGDQAWNHENTIWVPIARISRRSAEPVDIRDASGRKIPKLTQYETARLMASGLYRLLLESLRSHPSSSNPDSDLGRILFKIHEPRWLIQAALLALFTERNRPATATEFRQTPGTVPGHIRQYRNMALGVLDECADYLKDYLALLDVALNNHLIVVALDSTSDEHLLTYDSPLYVDERSTSARRLWQTLRASGEGYYVQYMASIPSALRSYHVVIEAGPGVDISPMYLSTDADARTVESLGADLDFLAGQLEKPKLESMDESARKLLELETQTALRKIAELVRRRKWEASHARIKLTGQYLPASFQLTQAVVAGEATMDAGVLNNSMLLHPNVSSQAFRAAAAELAGREMHYDFSLENDPVTNRAHAYWRRSPERSVNTGQIEIKAGAVLRDATGSGPRDALLYALSLAGTFYFVACFLAHSIWPYSSTAEPALQSIHSTEAVIAVLLLVPGFLYTRLTLPDPHSVSGHLRVITRAVARIGIFSVVVVAASIAANSSGQVIRLAFIVGTLLPLASTGLLLRGRSYTLRKKLSRMGAPIWVSDKQAAGSRAVVPDVRFLSSGVNHE